MEVLLKYDELTSSWIFEDDAGFIKVASSAMDAEYLDRIGYTIAAKALRLIREHAPLERDIVYHVQTDSKKLVRNFQIGGVGCSSSLCGV